jgi:hypothetical protein
MSGLICGSVGSLQPMRLATISSDSKQRAGAGNGVPPERSGEVLEAAGCRLHHFTRTGEGDCLTEGSTPLYSPFSPSPLLEQTMDVSSVLLQLISGAVGGNVAGLANKAKSLGPR